MTSLERIAKWTELVEQWESVGGSRKVFCESNGIGYIPFLSWCRRLRPSADIAGKIPGTPECVKITHRSDARRDEETLVIESSGITMSATVIKFRSRNS